MTRRRVLLLVLLVLLVAAACYFAITAVNMVRNGAGDTDPAAYWGAFALIAAVGAGLVWASWRGGDVPFGERRR